MARRSSATRVPDTDAGGGVGGRRARAPRRRRSTAWQYTESFLVAIALALVFRQFVVQAFRIPSSSMEQTLLVGDFLFVNKFLYGAQLPFSEVRLPRLRAPERGDIIVFRSPQDGRDFIKRCVAVAGDTVEIRAKKLYLNGVAQEEDYALRGNQVLPPSMGPRDFYGPLVVPQRHLFMMGDNRDNSHDSRYWGPLPVSRVRGKAMVIYFSIDLSRGFLRPNLRLRRFGRLIH